MTWPELAMLASIVSSPFILLAIALFILRRWKGRPGIVGIAASFVSLLLVFSAICILIGMLLPAVARVREAGPVGYAQNDMKQIMLAMHNYASTYRDRLPPQAIRSKDGKPLLSWRVAILPYIESEHLYREFHLDEPWDSPHNIKLLPRMPRTYQPPVRHEIELEPGFTYYQAITGKGSAFEEGSNIARLPHGTTNTVMVVEAGEAVPWTKPVDLEFDAEGPLPALGGVFQATGWGHNGQRIKSNGTVFGMGDGRVFFVDRDVSDETIRDLLSGNGGEALASVQQGRLRAK
jgi:hypothetical protein